MPILVRYTQLSPWQAGARKVIDWMNRWGKTVDSADPPPDPWRCCFWIVKSGARPVANRSPLLLTPSTPLEILTTLDLRGLANPAEAPTGRALATAAEYALRRNVLDSKRPLMVLCDWLEENALPESGLLREFASSPQCWLHHCLEISSRALRVKMV